MATAKPERVRYLTLADIETLAVELASAMSERRGERMPSLQTLGGAHGAEVIAGILDLPRQSAGGKPAYLTIFR